MLELVAEAGFEARGVPWFAGGYHGMLWIFGLGPSWFYEVLDSKTWFDHATSGSQSTSNEGDSGQVPDNSTMCCTR